MSKYQVKSPKTPKIYKNKKLNNANYGDFTLNDYQVFLHLISKIGFIDEFGKYVQPDKIKREYILKAKEFSDLFHVDIHYSYKLLKSAVDKLMKTDIKIEKIAQNEVCRINVCSMAQYNKSEGKITIEFTDRIMPYLSNQASKRFTIYNLKEISNFGSLYTTRLYELIQDFKETGWIYKSLEELREFFALGNKFLKYGHFKSKILNPACKEINNNYEMDLEFTEIKESRKVVAIKFTFKKAIPKKVFNKVFDKESIVYEKPKSKKITLNNTKNKENGELIKTNLQINKSNNHSVIKQEKFINDKKIIEGNNNDEVTKNKNAFTSFLKRFLS